MIAFQRQIASHQMVLSQQKPSSYRSAAVFSGWVVLTKMSISSSPSREGRKDKGTKEGDEGRGERLGDLGGGGQ